MPEPTASSPDQSEDDRARVRVVMVLEAWPADPADGFDRSTTSAYVTQTIGAVRSAGFDVATVDDVRDLGVHVTVAVREPKVDPVIPTAAVRAHAAALGAELDRFPHLQVVLAMGDVAIAAVNQVARSRTGRRVVPAGSTYRIRGGDFSFDGIRVLPSYLPTGRSFLIERSKREMVAEDIRAAFAIVGAQAQE